MMMDFRDKQKRQLIPVKAAWHDELRTSLIQHNNNFMQNHLVPSPLNQVKLWKKLSQRNNLPETNNYGQISYPHGQYSQFIPVHSNYLPNTCELSEFFPYLKHLKDNQKIQFEQEVLKINELLPDNKNTQKYRQACRPYTSGMGIDQLINCLMLLKKKGTAVLEEIKTTYCPNVSDEALFWELCQVKRWLKQLQFTSASQLLSQDTKKSISLQSLSQTYKLLFCPICMLYDCQKHPVPQLAIRNNYHYVNNRSQAQRTRMMAKTLMELIVYLDKLTLEDKPIEPVNKINNVVEIIGLDQQVVNLNYQAPTEQTQSKQCSDLCYRKMTKQQWFIIKTNSKLQHNPLVQSFLKMAIQIYGFNPCKAHLIVKFPTKKVAKMSCRDILHYFVAFWSPLSRIQHKFCDSQVQHLRNQRISHNQIQIQARERSRNRRRTRVQFNHNHQHTSICIHHIIGKQSTDLNCRQCECAKRGYCLPQCGCSPNCPLQLKGCRCRNQNDCLTQRCPCFKANRVCHPLLCYNCNSADTECKNNTKAISNPPLTLISESQIPRAGLGLFAGQFIKENAFVAQYLGEVVQSESLQGLRESLLPNCNYTFRVKDKENVDSRRFGNNSRFVNHSTNPNLSARIMRVNEEDRVIFRALRDINKGEQLLLDYHMNQFRQRLTFL